MVGASLLRRRLKIEVRGSNSPMGKHQRTNDDVFNSYVEDYRCRVSRGASIREVVDYGLKKGHFTLPKPKDPKEALIQRVTKAQRKQMSYDEVLEQEYHANICYLSGDEVHWINHDKADLNKFLYNGHLKRNIAIGILTGLERSAMHWNRTRPADQQVLFEKDLGPDVEWRLNQSNQLGENRKTGS
jgi:hypothetical protein